MAGIDLIPAAILAIVFVLIAIRQVGSFRLAIWQIMLAGALASLATGSIGPLQAAKAIDLDVMAFLAGMFVVGEALVMSRYLHHLSFGLFSHARTSGALVFSILVVMGIFSAFLMNDTVAVIGTPLLLHFAQRHNISSKLLLLTLCFATTLGSVASPIGNPQNLLIALEGGTEAPFTDFFRYLAAPTAVNIVLAFFVLRFFYRKEFGITLSHEGREPVADRRLAGLARLSLVIIAVLVVARAALAVTDAGWNFRLTWIAVAASLPILVLSPRRVEVARKIDWHTLVFFASMFVLMESVWASGIAERLISLVPWALSAGVVMLLGALASQLLSNVPFVALYLPALTAIDAPVELHMALAAGSTVAGNLLVLGAASNIIVIQNAERRAGATITFLEFARVGVPLTFLNIVVYWLYFAVT